MRFPLATLATAALIFSASAVPHRGHGKGRNSTDTEQGGKGSGRGRHSASLPGPALTAAPTALPTGGTDLSTVSFELPVSAAGKWAGISRAKSDDSDEISEDESSGSSNSSEGSKDEESSSDDSTSGGKDQDTSSGSGDKETSSGSGNEESSSGSGDESSPGDSSESGDEESSSDSDDESSSGSGLESGDDESSSGSGGLENDESSSGSGSGSRSGGNSSGGSSSGGSSNSTTPSTPSSGGSSASGSFPAAAGESTLSAPMEVTDFDGGMVKFGRGVSCSSGEGGDSDAVFIVADGGSLSNVIIGPDQIEGVHCAGACTITNVWWEAVCEDALSFKGNGDGTVFGGGAKGAQDKVVQHNGVGTISISNFQVEDFGKLYRSCGNCKTVSPLPVLHRQSGIKY